MPPEKRQIVLALPFFLHLHNILDEAEHRLLEGAPVLFSELATLISARLRENLVIIYVPGEGQGR